MAKLLNKCETCGKIAVEQSSTLLKDFGVKVIKLKCGHAYTIKLSEAKDYAIVSSDGRSLFPYQIEGIKFAEESGYRCLIGDEMGLGKTVQALGTLKLHGEELQPVLFILKSALKRQFFGEILRWCGIDYMPQVIESTKDKPIPGFKCYIVSYDLLWRFTSKSQKARDKAADLFRANNLLNEYDPLPEEFEAELDEKYPVTNPFYDFGFKTIIIDECQQIKNSQSKRAIELNKVAKQAKHIIALSGTPIKNNAGEYFTILNILKPERFPFYGKYIDEYCDAYDNGYTVKIGGIKDIEHFRDVTKDFIIRRERQEVLPELPVVNRMFRHADFASKKMEDEYQNAQEDFEDYFYENEDKGGLEFYQNLLAKMAHMRHLAGKNKVPHATEFIMDFLMDTNRKITVFVHHQDVGTMLEMSLIKEIAALRNTGSTLANPLTYTSDMSTDQRANVIERFRNDEQSRILIASTLAAGEGLNLQFCSDCIILERQWNPANEEQVEGRFVRIGSQAQELGISVGANYILSTGTIDEYFTELVEQKRSILKQTLDGKETQWDQQSLMKELASILAQKGGKRWKLK